MEQQNEAQKFCRDCRIPLDIKPTKRKPSQLTQPYYYTAYYSCPNCKKMYHDEAFKVVNKNYTLFTEDTLSPSEIDVIIWTDGACSNNGKPNAKASWAFVSGEYEAAGLVEGKQTNNTGEGLAIYYALMWAAERGYKKVKIATDSQISIHNLSKPPEKVKENREIFEKIDKVIRDNHLKVVYEKVLGHSDNINNNRADKLANNLVGLK